MEYNALVCFRGPELNRASADSRIKIHNHLNRPLISRYSLQPATFKAPVAVCLSLADIAKPSLPKYVIF